MFQCTLCTKEFTSAVSLAGHRSGHVRRGELPKQPTRNIERKCPICLKDFKRLGTHLPVHSRSVDDVKHPTAKKRRLIENRGHRCEVCLSTIWMGKSIPLHIDHIDGHPDHDDSTNLRLLCPNCHAQTPTYCGLNIGRNGVTKRQMIMKDRKPYR